MSASDVVISADRISRRFGRLLAVDNVSFEVPRAAIFGFLGPNGSGKSTIIRMLCGVLRPSSGGGRVLGADVEREAETVKRSIGYMSQKFSLYADLTVAENLDFYGRIYGLSAGRLRQRKQAVLDMVLMHDRLAQFAGNLSGGWKQRLALACALIHEPRVLFLDEPTAGIDPVARRDLWDLLFELSAHGVTMFVTTHYMDEAERCSLVGYIYNSRLIAFGRPDELKKLERVTPRGTRRVEATCAAPAQALRALKNTGGVQDATLFGETIHLLIDADLPDAKLAEVLTSALPGGAPSPRIRAISPTLEDVFVTLSRSAALASDGAAGAAAPVATAGGGTA